MWAGAKWSISRGGLLSYWRRRGTTLKKAVDLAAFHAEQALQLALKYLLARDYGHYPHTHDLRGLIF
mgnify:CR=1 FL=1